MATIGTFTASNNGFTGSVKTLTLNVKATFVATEKENDKAPDYRILAGATEFGAAWKKTARETDRMARGPAGRARRSRSGAASTSFWERRASNMFRPSPVLMRRPSLLRPMRQRSSPACLRSIITSFRA